MSAPRLHVLVVCKANVTRSPLTAALLRRDARLPVATLAGGIDSVTVVAVLPPASADNAASRSAAVNSSGLSLITFAYRYTAPKNSTTRPASPRTT